MQSPARGTSRILSALQGSGGSGGNQNSSQNSDLTRVSGQTQRQSAPNLQTALSTLDEVLTDIENNRLQAQDVEPSQVTQPTQPPADSVASPIEETQAKTQQVPQQPAEEVLTNEDQIPQTVAPAVPLMVDQQLAQQQQEQQQQVGSSAKESLVGATPDQGAVEAATGIAYVEQEKSPELPVEVEGFLQKVEEHTGQEPQRIVISDDQNVPLASHYPKKSVIVLPITQEIEKEGQSKNPKFSIRWLVEWSRKLMKMFSGKIIYRQVEESQS